MTIVCPPWRILVLGSPPPKTKRRTMIDMLEADSCSSDVSEAIRMIRRISQEYERSCPNDVESDTMTHAMRMKAVDELLRSHTDAAEMRRRQTRRRHGFVLLGGPSRNETRGKVGVDMASLYWAVRAEMRRAAKSASTWLRYIGRSDASTDERAPGRLKKIKVETNKARIKLNRNKRMPTRWNQLL